MIRNDGRLFTETLSRISLDEQVLLWLEYWAIYQKY
jgi:hypothetical protein